MTETTTTEWIAIAAILRPQGRRGEVLAELLTDLDEMFEDGREVRLAKTETAAANGAVRTLESHFFPTGRNVGRVVVKLSGCESINDAELLAGQQLFVPTEELPELEEGTWLVRDLVGCQLFDQGKAVGEIVDVQFAVGSDGRSRLDDAPALLEIQPPAKEGEEPEADTQLVPLVNAWIEAVDLDAKSVRMSLPEGLLEL
ncbi:ribosome maturation factor RimM [Granulicella cerasi]|uniref:ribosome maturation factor RimM n=1 Tax=Granulicella cerasi TaxID=741063 RepID=UPI0021E0420F|nr:ribosome maturation factor RimM [Granulicella cerasi]